ncbi:MAG: hypothetical protein IPL79_01525 [Myxococcales bacterium]|nr:hypothetical protein [Myxococcales bacterium]
MKSKPALAHLVTTSLALTSFATMLLPPRAVTAAPTQTWTLESFAHFDAGDTQDGYVASTGEVRPGWLTKRVTVPGNGIWAAVRLASGTVLAGTDDKGAIYKIDGDKATPFATIPGAIAITALTTWGDAVYAATLPGNVVWKLDPRTGKAASFCTIKDVETVWALAASAGTLYAGTGPTGQLWAISTSGAAKLAFASGDKRITAITLASDKSIWFGTSERAIVYRLEGSGTPRAMADFAGNEISAIVESPRGIIVAANEVAEPTSGVTKTAAQIEAQEKPGAPRGQVAKTPELGSKPGAEKDSSGSETPRKNARKGKGAVFVISATGALEQLHALTQTYVTSLAVDRDGAVFVGSADKGRVYIVEPDGSVGSAFDTDDRAISHMGFDGKGLWFTSDDAAALYRVTTRAGSARFVSEVFDAKTSAQFGRLYWQAAGAIKVETRTGNTAQPDDGWSAWAAPGKPAEAGAGVRSGKVSSPSGRYVQVRATLGDAGTALRRLALYYAPQNQPTRIESVSVEPTSKETFVTLKDHGGRARNPLLRIKWTIDNADSDDTRYTLAVQREKDSSWRKLHTGTAPLTATQWEWNTETFADGWYRVKVTASDLAHNPPGAAKTALGVSPWFLVDNTKPALEGMVVKGAEASATASDGQSAIAEMAYSIDDGDWQFGAAADGIYDDLRESVTATLPADLPRGAHTLTMRVADAAGNVVTSTTSFTK